MTFAVFSFDEKAACVWTLVNGYFSLFLMITLSLDERRVQEFATRPWSYSSTIVAHSSVIRCKHLGVCWDTLTNNTSGHSRLTREVRPSPRNVWAVSTCLVDLSQYDTRTTHLHLFIQILLSQAISGTLPCVVCMRHGGRTRCTRRGNVGS